MTGVNLNAAQTVFALFFAISWGTAANAQPKWKAFAWGQFREPKTIQRLFLSVVLLNVVPVAFFVIVLHWLGGPRWTLVAWNAEAGLRIIAAMVPAWGPFGFLRIWTSAVQWKASWFYPDENKRCRLGIKLSPVDLNPTWAFGNFLFGIAYVIVGLAIPYLCS